MVATVLGLGWWETTMGSGAGMGAAVGGDLGEDGVVMRANSRSKITSSLVVICRVLVVISRVSVAMVDSFWVRR